MQGCKILKTPLAFIAEIFHLNAKIEEKPENLTCHPLKFICKCERNFIPLNVFSLREGKKYLQNTILSVALFPTGYIQRLCLINYCPIQAPEKGEHLRIIL